jgi:hypothetical protein
VLQSRVPDDPAVVADIEVAVIVDVDADGSTVVTVEPCEVDVAVASDDVDPSRGLQKSPAVHIKPSLHVPLA